MSSKSTSDIIDFDFGFSFIDDEIEAVKETAVASEATAQELETQLSIVMNEKIDLESRMEKLYQSIEPFLDNLCKSPEKSTIFWPDRVEKIQNYKMKLKSIAEGS
jgi:hypothetical protein